MRIVQRGDEIQTRPGAEGYHKGEPIIKRYTVEGLTKGGEIAVRDKEGGLHVFARKSVEEAWDIIENPPD